jgi:glutathione-specific gamma-glutamylcyclotransferase
MTMDAPEWVFAYGSLMWRPDFEYATRKVARVQGYRRSLCIYSHIHRGTPERPGLVLGLDFGGSCTGFCYQLAPEKRQQVWAYLQEREQGNYAYRERLVEAQLEDGATVHALAYVVDRSHRQYAGKFDLDRAVELISQGKGLSGANIDYVRSTYNHLMMLGVKDRQLHEVVCRLDQQAS